MAEAKTTTGGAAGNTAVPAHGDHDRVAMLSLRPDGRPDQLAPEIIGDREFALEATREQFKQQAVSAADQQLRGVTDGAGTAGDAVQDPQIAQLQEAHEKAEQRAETAAQAAVDELFTDDPALSTAPAGKPVGDKPSK